MVSATLRSNRSTAPQVLPRAHSESSQWDDGDDSGEDEPNDQGPHVDAVPHEPGGLGHLGVTEDLKAGVQIARPPGGQDHSRALPGL